MRMTPGPWEVARDGSGAVYEAQYKTDICTVSHFRKPVGYCNARAIAAVPELVEACEKALQYIDDDISYFESDKFVGVGKEILAIRDSIKKALAKAGEKGE